MAELWLLEDKGVKVGGLCKEILSHKWIGTRPLVVGMCGMHRGPGI